LPVPVEEPERFAEESESDESVIEEEEEETVDEFPGTIYLRFMTFDRHHDCLTVCCSKHV